jgi:hypothetical protein
MERTELRLSERKCLLRRRAREIPAIQQCKCRKDRRPPIATGITRLITTGITEHQRLTAVAHKFPDLTTAELSQALQDAMAHAERQAVKRH